MIQYFGRRSRESLPMFKKEFRGYTDIVLISSPWYRWRSESHASNNTIENMDFKPEFCVC